MSVEQKRIYLWSVPRSLSSAFVRAMMSRDKCKVSEYTCTQSARLATSQNRCHQNNFIVVAKLVVKVVTSANQKVVSKTMEKAQ